tara:strand:- start:139 stop:393 length:255 start_codon:yes stop_codon:yes gene_type:complete
MKNKIIIWFRSLGSYSIGLFMGTCYGAVIATLTSYAILHEPVEEDCRWTGVCPVGFATVDEMAELLEELTHCEDEMGRSYGNMR